MGLLGLPNELFLIVCEFLEYESDINALARTNRRLYRLLDWFLYRHNIRYERCSALLWAAEKNVESTAKKLLSHNILQQYLLRLPKLFPSAVESAAGLGHTQMVKLLLENGSRNRRGLTADHIRDVLYQAAEEGHEAVIRLCLQYAVSAGVDLEVPKEETLTVLEAAASNGNLLVLKVLMDAWKVNKEYEYMPEVLTTAAGHGHFDVVEFLIEAGADPDEEHCDDKTALQCAAAAGHVEVVRVLLNLVTREADPDPTVVSALGNALIEAAVNGHHDVVKLFLQRVVFQIATGVGGEDVLLCVAAECGLKSLAKWALSAGANPNTGFVLSPGPTQVLLVLPVVSSAKHGHEEIFKLLLDSGAQPWPFFGSHPQLTPFIVAACNGQSGIVRLLLRMGADPGIILRSHPLLLDVVKHPDMFRLLLDHDPNITSNVRRFSQDIWCMPTALEVLLEIFGLTSLYKYHGPVKMLDWAIRGREETLGVLRRHGYQLPGPSSFSWNQALADAIREGCAGLVYRLLVYARRFISPEGTGNPFDEKLMQTVVLWLCGAKGRVAGAAPSVALEYHGDIEKKIDGSTVLYHAVDKRNEGAVFIILTRGANPLHRADSGSTPLSLGTWRWNPRILRLLLGASEARNAVTAEELEDILEAVESIPSIPGDRDVKAIRHYCYRKKYPVPQ